MSADIMPCGCEGHFDNLPLCKYPSTNAAYLSECEKNGRLEVKLAAALPTSAAHT